MEIMLPFDAEALQYIEDALSDGFKYHSALDSFLLRTGVTSGVLAEVRKKAELRAANSTRFGKAPKRFVVQYLLQELSDSGIDGDRIIASIVTNIIKIPLPDASETAQSAIQALRTKIKADKDILAERRAEEQKKAAEDLRHQEKIRETDLLKTIQKRDQLRDRFLNLISESNAQARGYLLESLLLDLFEFENLNPRKSFKLIGEQIDGAFIWRNRTYLVEAKWTKDLVAGREFGAFNYKIEGKTADTRGMFISINGYSPEAIKGMNAKGALKFICIDGAHLMRALTASDGLVGILERIWRHADETGEAYLPASML